MRSPRLNSAVATVAVEMVLNLLRVASLRFDMILVPSCSSFRDAPERRRLGIHTPDRGYGFRARGYAAPRNDGANKSMVRRPACRIRFPGNRNRSLHWPA